ncbi:hypothetical protein [Labilibacter marinus]|uniref:hypothetical protein n=1 Tax=Labilibacter marinus TaxID=1477105 RepID=UPI000831092C|nr:hypothetical protein [Labilibacter marinus]
MELTIKDIQEFYGVSPVTARARVKEIKEALNLKKKGRVLLAHMAKYEALTIEEVKNIMKLKEYMKRTKKD